MRKIHLDRTRVAVSRAVASRCLGTPGLVREFSVFVRPNHESGVGSPRVEGRTGDSHRIRRMAVVRSFSALRPAGSVVAKVSAVPYDVVSTEEARQLAAGNPLSFLHVSRPEIDLPDGTDPHADAVYAKAAENFEKLKIAAPLHVEGDRALYVYRLRVGPHEQTGIAGCCSIDDYDRDVVRKHERTRRDKEDDRTKHMIALSAQTGPVFLTYRDDAAIDAVVQRVKRDPPLYDFSAPDGVAHTIWRVGPDRRDALTAAFELIDLLYIADGHHRAASASRAAAHYRSLSPGDHQDSNEFDFFLAVLFPASQVRILAYNRAVKELNGKTPERVLDEVRRRFTVKEGAASTPSRRGEIAMYLAGRWYGLVPREAPSGSDDAIGSLDVSILQDRILSPVLGIKDIRTDKRIEFVGGIRGAAELERLVDSGAAAVAFSLYPVSVNELIAISDANEIMPPKSTWFEPKLRDGLLVHLI
jgi:uncharacterized protein (DUF1015 family)